MARQSVTILRDRHRVEVLETNIAAFEVGKEVPRV